MIIVPRPTCVVLIGPSGSGKTTYAAHAFPNATKVSADDYFTDDEGTYVFVPERLPDAHAACMNHFVHEVLSAKHTGGTILVDNTNTTALEIAPYIAVAEAYGFAVQVHVMPRPNVDDPVLELYVRGDHGVAQHTIARQIDNIRLMLRDWPRRWPEPQFITQREWRGQYDAAAVTA